MDSVEVKQLATLLEYVRVHYMERITDETAARIACMSYHHFCWVFKRVTGRTFVEYLRFVRICEAEKLLTTTDKSITTIAMETDFGASSYFIRLFKQAKGLSPLEYRKQNHTTK